MTERTSAPKYDQCKVSVYVPVPMMLELREQSKRLDRPMSWFFQQALAACLGRFKKLPDQND